MVAFVHSLIWFLSATTGSGEVGGLERAAMVAPALAPREWMSASGGQRAVATLIRVDGDKLWLRTPDGRLATTTKGAVSAADRQYLAAYEAGLAASRTLAPRSSISQALGKLPSRTQVAVWGQSGNSESTPRVVPAALVYVRVSRELIEDYVERTVRTRKPVRDCVLGTRILGESDTVGKTRITLLPSKNSISGEVGFYGTVNARTTGYNGPAIFQFRSEASFRARKPIALGESGLSVAPAVAIAPTELQTIGVRTTLPGLRGRIATRIATRRDASSRSEAEAIISRHSAATIREDFDERIDQSIAKVKRVLQLKVPGLGFEPESELVRMRYRSTPDYIEMAMIRQNATAEELSLRPPMVVGDPDFAIRVNRGLFGQAIADSELSETLAPLAVQLLGSRFVEKALAAAAPKAEQLAESAKWSIDHDWVALEFTDVARLRALRADASDLSAE